MALTDEDATSDAAVARRVKFVRDSLQMDQTAFAELLGLSGKSVVSTWETKGTLSLRGARLIRRRVGYSLDFLIDGDVSKLTHDQMKLWNDWRLTKSSA